MASVTTAALKAEIVAVVWPGGDITRSKVMMLGPMQGDPTRHLPPDTVRWAREGDADWTVVASMRHLACTPGPWVARYEEDFLGGHWTLCPAISAPPIEATPSGSDEPVAATVPTP